MKLNDMSKDELITLGKSLSARVNGRMKPMTLIDEIGKVSQVERTLRGEPVCMERMSKDELLEYGLMLDLMIDARMNENTIINLIIAEQPEAVDYVLIVPDHVEPESPTAGLFDKLTDLESDLDEEILLPSSDLQTLEELEDIKNLHENEESPSTVQKLEVPLEVNVKVKETIDESERPKSTIDIRRHMYGIDGRSKRKIIQMDKITCEYLYKYGICHAYDESIRLNAAPLVKQKLLAMHEFWTVNEYLVVRNTWNSWMLRFDKRGFRE
jgi:hypothetical protein